MTFYSREQKERKAIKSSIFTGDRVWSKLQVSRFQED